jgi:hypothetical protein
MRSNSQASSSVSYRGLVGHTCHGPRKTRIEGCYVHLEAGRPVMGIPVVDALMSPMS